MTRIGKDKGEAAGLSKRLVSTTGKAVGKNTSGLSKDAKTNDNVAPPLEINVKNTQDINRVVREKVYCPPGNGQLQIQQSDRSKHWGEQREEETISITGSAVKNDGPTNPTVSPKKQDKISLLTDWGKDNSDKFYSLTEESDLSSADHSHSDSDESESYEAGNKSLNCEFTVRQIRQRRSAKPHSDSQESHENATSMSGRTLRWDYSGISLADTSTSGNQGSVNDRNERNMGASAGDIGDSANNHEKGTEAGILQSIYNSIKELQTETRIESCRARIATKKLQGSVGQFFGQAQHRVAEGILGCDRLSSSKDRAITPCAVVRMAMVELLKRVGTPLKRRSEVRIVSGANSLNLKELAGETLDSGSRQSTSQGTDICESVYNMQEELLDYDHDQYIEEGEIVEDLVGRNVGQEAKEKYWDFL
ncbi:hypothetical protein NDU88_003120 [Pleurodeles waltl]|uniref:Uncharacterized protein n=1 Tax=Pleurodeles waltl TaxID=8319 RepID=A0AAV7UF06_PLEWA|nr:hypothetical protein NDU88_003120 [Pleurodeles waltl]